MTKVATWCISAVFLVGACTTGINDGSGDEFVVPDSILNAEEAPLEVSDEAMADIVQNISSPVEMAALIQESGYPFQEKYLFSTDQADEYHSRYQKALALGIFGADLGYLNMYNKTGPVIEYITVIKSLADNLKVGQFFDFQILKRMATNSTNLDSLMYISVSSFDQMDKYLRENNRSNISTLIVTGVWIEGMYLAGQVIKTKPNEEISERIGEQKIILNDLMLILKNYRADGYFRKLIKKVEELKNIYKNVRISYEVGEPESVEKDGMLVIVQNEKSIVDISDEDLNAIINKIEDIRNNILNQ